MEQIFADWEEYENWLEKNDPKKQQTKEDLSKDDKKKDEITTTETEGASGYLDDIDMPVEDYDWRNWFTEGFVWNDRKF